MTDNVLKKAEEQAKVIAAEKHLLDSAEKFIPKELTDKVEEMITSIFAGRGMEMNVPNITAFLEGVRFSMTVIPEDRMQDMTMFVLSTLKIKDRLEKNGFIAHKDTNTTSQG